MGDLPLRGAARYIEGGRRPFLGELPLRGAARYRGREETLSYRDLPLREASCKREGGDSFWGSSRCAGLLGRWSREETLSWGAPAARGFP